MFNLLRRSRPSLPPRRRIYAVGDIHGRLDLLERISAAIAADDAERGPANTDIVLLGDLIDRGPESRGVIRYAMSVKPAFANIVTLKGNHEATAIAALGGNLDRLAAWLHFGGRDTLESFGLPISLLEGDDLDAILAAARVAVPVPVQLWLKTLPTRYPCGDYLFVHAGIRPDVPIDEQVEEDLVWIRGDFLESRKDHGVTVVHGHTVTKQPVIRANRIGLDTGAWFSDRLTAIGFEGTRRWLLST